MGVIGGGPVGVARPCGPASGSVEMVAYYVVAWRVWRCHEGYNGGALGNTRRGRMRWGGQIVRAGRYCTCPPTGPGKPNGRPCGSTSSATRQPNHAPPEPTDQSVSTPPPQARPEEPHRKSWYRPADHTCAATPTAPLTAPKRADDDSKPPVHGSRLSYLCADT